WIEQDDGEQRRAGEGAKRSPSRRDRSGEDEVGGGRQEEAGAEADRRHDHEGRGEGARRGSESVRRRELPDRARRTAPVAERGPEGGEDRPGSERGGSGRRGRDPDDADDVLEKPRPHA